MKQKIERKILGRALSHKAEKSNQEAVLGELEKQDNKIDLALEWFKRQLDDCPYTEWAPKDHKIHEWADALVDKDAVNGIEQNLRTLFHSPKGPKDDTSQPWFSRKMTAAKARSFVKKFQHKVPSWALEHDNETLSGISKPTNSGFVVGTQSTGYTTNKGGDNMLTARRNHPHIIREDRMDYAVNKLCKLIIDCNGGSKVKVPKWDLETFATEMRKAIKSSTPGYPFNSFEWEAMLDGKPIYEHVFDRGMTAIENGYQVEDGGFKFFMGGRNTGDRGNKYSVDGNIGAKRATFPAEAGEKAGGHMFVYPLKKSLLRHSPLSGQRGIQEVSYNLKEIMHGDMQGECSSERGKIVFHDDVGQWDGAATLRDIIPMIDRVLKEAYDLEDEWTKKVYDWYMQSIADAWVYTPWGWTKCIEKPSGASITTVFAFILQYLYWFEMEYDMIEQYGESPYVSLGFQGDDILIVFKDWDNGYFDVIRSVYADHNCKLKGGDNLDKVTTISGNGDAALFLSERIYIDDKEVPNFRSLKWQFFFAEQMSDLGNGVDIDRALLDEIRSRDIRKVHYSPRELHMASILSKLDTLVHLDESGEPINRMDYERWICIASHLWTHNHRDSFPLRSWIGARVMPNSPTAALWAELEERAGITPPPEEEQIIDRQQSPWWMGESLGCMFAMLAHLSENAPKARPAIRRLVKAGRQNLNSFKKAKKTIQGVVSEDKVSDLQNVEILKRVLIKVMDETFHDLSAELQGRTIKMSDKKRLSAYYDAYPTADNQGEAMQPKTIADAVLGLNLTNPFELAAMVQSIIIRTRMDVEWLNLSEEWREKIANFYREFYGGELISDVVLIRDEQATEESIIRTSDVDYTSKELQERLSELASNLR